MTAKIAELQQSVKVHREKSGTFSQKMSAKLSVLPQDATWPQPLQCPLCCLEFLNLDRHLIFLFATAVNKKYKRGDTLSHERGLYSWVTPRHKSVTCSKNRREPRKTKWAPKVRRESVWLFPTASIFQTHQAVNLLYLKSIYFPIFTTPVVIYTTQYYEKGARRSCWSSWRSAWVTWSVATPTTPPRPLSTGLRK